jgi:drug/metabolite transporter (DMT)-like permease
MNPFSSADPKAQQRALWVLIIIQLITGSTYLVAKIGLQEFDPLSLGFFRFLISAVVFAAIFRQQRLLKWPDRRDRKLFILCGLLAVPLNQGLFLFGIKSTLAAHGALLYATTPMAVLMLSAVILQERPNTRKISGILLGFFGVAMVLLEKGLHFSLETFRGDALVSLAVLTWALYTIYSKQLLGKYPPLYLTGMSLMIGSVLFVPIGLPAILHQDFSRITIKGIGSLLYLSLLTSVVSYYVWSWL